MAGPRPRTTLMLRRAWVVMASVMPGRDQLFGRVRRPEGDRESSPQEDEEQEEGEGRADEPGLLAEDGEDEVRMGEGEEEQLLGALAEAHPEQAARADRQLGLVDLEARAQGVLVGRDEALDPVHPVIGLEEVEP